MSDRLPDPETTDAEAIEVSDEAVLPEIPEDNPFRDTLVELRDDGHSWRDIYTLIEAAYEPVDQAAYEEGFVEAPVYEIEAIVPDEAATSGKASKTMHVTKGTPEEARDWATDQPEVVSVEHVAQVDTRRVG